MFPLLQNGKQICFALTSILFFSGNCFAQVRTGGEEDRASDIWTDAFIWMQTGRKLAKAKQWPLALGSYIEALQKFETVAADFPEFETELVAFRLNTLKEDMVEVQNNLASDDHDVMMAYLDFVETMEKGQKLRFENDFEAALPTLRFAMTLLEEVIANRPGEFRAAVDEQYDRLEGSIDWIEKQQIWKLRNLPVVTASGGNNPGTTEFIKESDMPGDPMVSISTRLFPDLLAVQTVPEKRKYTPVKMPDRDWLSKLPKSFGPKSAPSQEPVGEKENSVKESELNE